MHRLLAGCKRDGKIADCVTFNFAIPINNMNDIFQAHVHPVKLEKTSLNVLFPKLKNVDSFQSYIDLKLSVRITNIQQKSSKKYFISNNEKRAFPLLYHSLRAFSLEHLSNSGSGSRRQRNSRIAAQYLLKGLQACAASMKNG